MWKPARIKGKIPEDYSGPVYYRIAQFSEPRGQLFGHGDRKKAQALASAERGRHMYTSGEIVDARGELLPAWRIPIRARIPARVKKLSPEFFTHSPSIVSARMRSAIEDLEPSRCAFIPIDAVWTNGDIERWYYFCPGETEIYYLLHREKNELPIVHYANGKTGYHQPSWLTALYGTEHFGYLDKAKVAGHHLMHNGFWVFSQEMVDRVGDVLMSGEYFVPMGIA